VSHHDGATSCTQFPLALIGVDGSSLALIGVVGSSLPLIAEIPSRA
jgi:hypothetical protein